MLKECREAVEFFKRNDLITVDQAKFKKSATDQWVQVGLTLSPKLESGTDLCPCSSPGCENSCLISTWRMRTDKARDARIRRTRLFLFERETFLFFLNRDLCNARGRAAKVGKRLIVRFGTMSDQRSERLFLGVMNKRDQYIDYTKDPIRYKSFMEGNLPPNYHLTFSRSERNERSCLNFLSQGGTVTMVVRNKTVLARMLGKRYKGYQCHNGDLHDRRWEDPPGHWILLLAKGKAKQDQTGFVVD